MIHLRRPGTELVPGLRRERTAVGDRRSRRSQGRGATDPATRRSACRVDGRTCVRYADGVLLSGPRSRPPSSVSDRAALVGGARTRGGARWLQMWLTCSTGPPRCSRSCTPSTSTASMTTRCRTRCWRCSGLRGRLDAAEARGAVALGCPGRLARIGRQDRRRLAGVAAAGADPGGPPAPPPRARDAHPARHRGGVGGGRHRSSPRHHAPRRSHCPHGTGLRRRSRAAARPRPHPRVRGLQARLRPLGDDRRPRRRRARRRRRPGGSRGAPVPELRRDVVRSRHARPGVG